MSQDNVVGSNQSEYVISLSSVSHHMESLKVLAFNYTF